MLRRTARGRDERADRALSLGVTVHAVKFHLASIFRKLGVRTARAAAAIYLAQLGRTGEENDGPRTLPLGRLALQAPARWPASSLATLIAVLSFVRIGLDGGKPTLAYRAARDWLSASTLFVTQEGFPWGRAILDEMIEVEPRR